MKMTVAFLKKGWPYGILLLLLVILFWQVLFYGYVFVDGDNFHLNMPLKYLLIDALHNHFFPFWNPYIFAGVPYAADLNVGTFNPPNILYLLFSVPRALTLQVIVDLFLVGNFQFLLLLRLHFEKLSALIGAIVFMLSGSIFAFTNNIAILNTIVYIPIIFLFIQLYLQTKKLRYFAVLIFIQTLQIISGHPQITYYTIFFVCLFVLFHTSLTFKNRLIILGSYILSTVFLASFQLAPFVQLAMNSNRPHANFAYASSGSLDIFHLIPFVFPMFFGTKLQGNWWGAQSMLTGYVGITSLLLLAFGLIKGALGKKVFFVVSLVISFLLALGKYGGIFFLFYFLIPGWSAFRSPSMIIVFTTFYVSIFVSSGFSYIQNNQRRMILGKPLIFLNLSALLLCLILSFVINHNVYFIQTLHYVSTFLPQLRNVFFYSDSKIQGIFSGIILSFLYVSFFLVVTCLFIWRFSKKLNSFFFLLFICLDLFLVDRTYLQLAPLSFYSNTVKNVHISTSYRIFAKPVVIEQDRRIFPGSKYFYNESLLNLREITDDHAVEHTMQTITGYNAIVLKNYAAFTNSVNVTGIAPQNLTDSMLDTLSVKYILSLDDKGNLVTTERQTAIPRIRLLSKENHILNTKSTPNMIAVRVVANRPDTLVLADAYYPGWETTVNGKKQRIQVYQNLFLSVKVPKGNSIVVFSYNPWIWELGLGISLLTLISGTSCLYIFRKYV